MKSVRLVARLGGFLARKGDGAGCQNHLAGGMQRIIDFAAGISLPQELLAQGRCV